MNIYIVLFVAQESSGTQGVLGPTKIYLAVQPPDDPHPLTQQTDTVTTATTQAVINKPTETIPQLAAPVPENVPNSSTQIKTSEQVTKNLNVT